MKKAISLFLAFIMMLSLVACAGTKEKEAPVVEETPAASAASEEPFVLSMMLPVSGYPGAAKAYQNGAAIAVDEINAAGGVLGRQFEIVVEDMGTTPDVALNAFNKIAAEGNSTVVLGCAFSSCALTLEYRLPEEKILMISGATSPALAEIQNDYFFRGRTSDEYMARVAMSFIQGELAIPAGSKIGMLHDSSDFGVAAKDVFAELSEKDDYGFISEQFNTDDTDCATQVIKLENEGVDVIVVWTSSGFPVASRAIYEQGVTCPVIGSAAVANASVLTSCTEWIEGWYAVTDICLDAPIDGITEFVESHNAKFDASELSFDALTVYSWVYLLKDAIERAGSFETEAITAALDETEDFVGLNGVYTKFGNVELLNNATIGKIESGEVHYITTAFAEIG